ncbi:MAG: hypothetical protein ACFB0D_11465 [Phormidesmis sp.]
MAEVVLPEEQQLLLAGYVLGDLTAEEGQVLEDMLLVNPDLQEELVAVLGCLESVYGVSAELPLGLRVAVLAGAVLSGREGLGSDGALGRSGRLGTHPSVSEVNRRWAWRGLGALAAGVIVALMVQNQTLRRDLEVLRAQQGGQLSAETVEVALSAADGGGAEGALERLTIDPVEVNAVLTAEGLESLAAGEVYALWTLVESGVPVTTDEKGAVLTAVFTVDAAGGWTQVVSLPGGLGSVDDVRAIAVSVEDADAPQLHQSSPILIEML